MPFAKKVSIAINLNEPHLEILQGVREMDFLSTSEIHVTSVYRTNTYAIGLGESSVMYPLEEDRKNIREQVLNKLNEYARTILPKSFKGKILFECLLNDDPKRKFTEYLADHHVDTVILAAREKRGIFESSFTQYVQKHSMANLIILKHLN